MKSYRSSILNLVILVTLSKPILADTVAEKPQKRISSQDIRSETQYSAYYQLFGIAEGVGQGIGIHKNIDAHSQLGFSYELAKEANSVGYLNRSYRATAQITAINYRYFLGNSFYFESGLAYHSKSIKRINEYLEIVNDVESIRYTNNRYTRSDLGGLFAIGNEWQWRHFSLGCDWVGFYQSLTETTVSGQKLERRSDGSDTIISMDKKDSDRYLNLRLLNFKLGYVF